MEPLRKDKPGPGLFLLMTAVYFASYFGLKYGVYGGDMPVLLNILLIAACLGLALLVRQRGRKAN
ncbi:hypothetical protein [Lewinella sp. JB7]|uniref:hypothetical protein n=1 Tax=Lewinella sp. JB7 TaxID=2962887 RepID=UPI0020C9BCE9|nr:hypothetical protein [Lewinella sp. JB7]MCP9235790.1 hypothetical protein [Lewinella sp. JB7]